MQYRWAGAMVLTWNSAPVVEEVEQGVWLAAGCNGVGATNATVNGIVAAERSLGHRSDLGRDFEKAAAAQRLSPEPFATLGGKAALKMEGMARRLRIGRATSWPLERSRSSKPVS